MCEFSGNLVAWLDGELPPGIAAEMEQHVAECAECRSCVTEFRKVSEEFQDYCDEVLQGRQELAVRRWTPVLCGVAAVAAGVLALVTTFFPRNQRPLSAVPAPVEIAGVAPAQSASQPEPAERPAVFADRGHRGKKSTVGRGVHASAANTSASVARCSQHCVTAKNTGSISSAAANDPAMQIAIPADAMFPPGAVPEGMSFVAEVQLGADGTVRQLELRPELVSIQRRNN